MILLLLNFQIIVCMDYYIKNGYQYNPRDIIHQKIVSKNTNQPIISSVFRALLPDNISIDLFHRWKIEQSFFPFSWDNYKQKSKHKIEFGQIDKSILTNNPFILLNSNINDYILNLNNNSKFFQPGDIFHKNPLVTAWLNIHPFYYSGKAISGNKDTGCCSIRVGINDIIIDPSKIYFYGEKRANTDNILKVEGSTTYLFKSWKNNTNIRVLLSAGVEWNGRKNNNNQYFFNYMFIHECKFNIEKRLWVFTLRTYPRYTKNIYNHCSCCE